MFFICFLQIIVAIYGAEVVDKNSIMQRDPSSKSIAASLDYPSRFRKIRFAKMILKDTKTQEYSKNIVLIKEGKAIVKSIDNPRSGVLTIAFNDFSYAGYDIDDDGKIIFHFKESDSFYRVRVSASEFLKELIRLHQ